MTNLVFMQIDPIQEAINAIVANYQIAVAASLILVIALVASNAVWLVREKWLTPQESKDIRSASRKKRPLVLLGGDDGFADIKPAAFSGPEGILKTADVGKTREHYTGALPRPHEFAEADVEGELAEGKDLKQTVAVANFLSMLANRRLLLRGARVPVWVAYRGKAILASLYGLVALQIIEGMAKDEKLKTVFAAVDVVAIKSLFSGQWNESQLNAQETDAERVGELKSKRFAGKESLIMFFAVMIFLVVAVILLLVVAYYFK